MNRTIRNLVIAVPLATVGLTMVNVGAASAGPNDPNFPIAIPEKPKGPQDKAPVPPKPKPKFDELPLSDAPKPKAPKPQPKPKPKPMPQSGNQVVAAPVAETVKAPKKVVAAQVASLMVSPDSVDRVGIELVAGPAVETTLEVAESDNGMDLTWLLVGGGIVTASGIAFAARKRANA